MAQKKKHVAEDEEDDDEKTAEKLEEELCEEERYLDMYEDMQKREIGEGWDFVGWEGLTDFKITQKKRKKNAKGAKERRSDLYTERKMGRRRR